MFINGFFLLVYEMGFELVFFVLEGIVGGLFICLINLFGIIFLLVFLILDIGMFLLLLICI